MSVISIIINARKMKNTVLIRKKLEFYVFYLIKRCYLHIKIKFTFKRYKRNTENALNILRYECRRNRNTSIHELWIRNFYDIDFSKINESMIKIKVHFSDFTGGVIYVFHYILFYTIISKSPNIARMHTHIVHMPPQDILRKISNQKSSSPRQPDKWKKMSSVGVQKPKMSTL